MKEAQFRRIRRDARERGMSVRELARDHGVHRRTVRAALVSPTPPPRKTPERLAPVMGPWLEIIRAWLAADLDGRHTARRVWRRLVDEHGAAVSESTVCRAVAKIRRELSAPQPRSENVEWYTPPQIFEALGMHFDLDPCSPGVGKSFVPANTHYTRADDGLAAPWAGSV